VLSHSARSVFAHLHGTVIKRTNTPALDHCWFLHRRRKGQTRGGVPLVNDAEPLLVCSSYFLDMEASLSRRLDELERSVDTLKRVLVSQDSIMTEEDYAVLLQYRKEKAAGRLADHEAVKRELGL